MLEQVFLGYTYTNHSQSLNLLFMLNYRPLYYLNLILPTPCTFKTLENLIFSMHSAQLLYILNLLSYIPISRMHVFGLFFWNGRYHDIYLYLKQITKKKLYNLYKLSPQPKFSYNIYKKIHSVHIVYKIRTEISKQ